MNTNQKTRIGMLMIVLLCAGAMSTFAVPKKKAGSGKGARAAFEKGDNTLGFSLGLGNVYTYSYYSGVKYLPAFSVYFDHGIISEVGPGTIGIGGVVGFQSSSYKYSTGEKATWTDIIVGARGTYHLTILKDKNNKFDPYGGVTVGIRSETYNNEYTGTKYGDYGGAYPFYGVFVGAKYNFSKHIGVFTELGYDISFLRIGLNANF